MSRVLPIAAVALAVAGCPSTTTITFQGDDLYEYFPFNGSRTWIYQSPDTSITYRVRGELQEDSVIAEDERTRIYTVDFLIDCVSVDDTCVDGDVKFSWGMSADSSKGTLFHSFDGQAFDPPVRLTEAQMNLGDTTETSSGGVDYVATYVAREPCPAPYWRGEVPDCLHMRLDGEGSPLAGDYWATYQFNIVAFALDASGETWQLRDFIFDD